MDAKQVKNGETKFCGIWVCMWEGNEVKFCELVFYGPDLSSGFAILMPSIGLKALPLKECISLRIHYFSLNIENIMFPYHMVPTKEIEKNGWYVGGGFWKGVSGGKCECPFFF